jgi:hypothetical protein
MVPLAGTAVGAARIAKRVGGLNLFRFGAKSTYTMKRWASGSRMLNLPNLGNPKANWKQNSGYLREVMREGKPIFDSFVDKAGNQRPVPIYNETKEKLEGVFLNAERKLLESRGWKYDPSMRAYLPPTPN